jgi:hypothetical protein
VSTFAEKLSPGPKAGKPARTHDAVWVWRRILIFAGIAVLLLSAVILLDTVKPTRYIGILIWFAAAIIIHDALIAPAVFVAGFVMRRLGRRIPNAVLGIIQGGIVIGAVFTIVLVPEILARKYAHLFPTLLPFDYLKNLGILWVGTLVLTAAVVVGYLLVSRARRSRRASS